MNREEFRRRNRKVLREREKFMHSSEGRLLIASKNIGASFEQACLREPKRHSSLLRIVELSELPDVKDEELLEANGIHGYKVYYWDSDNDPSGIREQREGGFMQIVHDAAEQYRTVMFIVRRKREGTAEVFNSVAGLAILYHELGHVSDFENRINFKIGQITELAKAELYAHHFACRRLKEEKLFLPLALYLGNLIKQHITSDNVAQRESAVNFWNSPEFQEYKILAAPFQTYWPLADDLPTESSSPKP